MAAGGSGDPHTQMNTYRSYVTMLADPGAKDEIKLKAAQELSENFEVTILKVPCGKLRIKYRAVKVQTKYHDFIVF